MVADIWILLSTFHFFSWVMGSYDSYLKLAYYSLEFPKFRCAQFSDCATTFILYKIVAEYLEPPKTSLSLDAYDFHFV